MYYLRRWFLWLSVVPVLDLLFGLAKERLHILWGIFWVLLTIGDNIHLLPRQRIHIYVTMETMVIGYNRAVLIGWR